MLTLFIKCTVETRFNKPLHNKVLGITNNILQPGQSYNKMYVTEPRHHEILFITNTIEKPKPKIYPDIMNKSYHVTMETSCNRDKLEKIFTYSMVYRSTCCVFPTVLFLYFATTVWNSVYTAKLL